LEESVWITIIIENIKNYKKIINIIVMKIILYLKVKKKLDKFYWLINTIKFFINTKLKLLNQDNEN
jgi:hypothetical protein